MDERDEIIGAQAALIAEQNMRIAALEKIIDIATGALNTVAGGYRELDPVDYAQDGLRRMKTARQALEEQVGR